MVKSNEAKTSIKGLPWACISTDECYNIDYNIGYKEAGLPLSVRYPVKGRGRWRKYLRYFAVADMAIIKNCIFLDRGLESLSLVIFSVLTEVISSAFFLLYDKECSTSKNLFLTH